LERGEKGDEKKGGKIKLLLPQRRNKIYFYILYSLKRGGTLRYRKKRKKLGEKGKEKGSNFRGKFGKS